MKYLHMKSSEGKKKLQQFSCYNKEGHQFELYVDIESIKVGVCNCGLSLCEFCLDGVFAERLIVPYYTSKKYKREKKS